MSSATLQPTMPRKKKTSDQDAPAGTAPVRIHADLARMAGIIAKATGEDVSDIISPILRPKLEAKYAEVIRELSDELGGKE
jgi:hypothetical protein